MRWKKVHMHDRAKRTSKNKSNYMVMAHFSLSDTYHVQFLTGKLMYQPQRRISLYEQHWPAHTGEIKSNMLTTKTQSQGLKEVHINHTHTSYWFGAGVLCLGPFVRTATGNLNTLETPVLKSCLSMKELRRLYEFGPGMSLFGLLEALLAYWRGRYDNF